MPDRFAIYYAPPTTSELWQRAARWLGRDAAAGPVSNEGIPGIDGTTLTAITPSASRYGFHATIKAPMALANGRTQAELEAAVEQFASGHAPVLLGPLEVRSLDGFLALTPVLQSDALTTFAGYAVTAFEPFRAPMSAIDRERRLKSGLSERQTELLDRFGYPYVMEQFLFHMTLTDRLDPATLPAVMAAAKDWFAPVLEEATMLDRLTLYTETGSGAPFRRETDYPLSTQVKV